MTDIFIYFLFFVCLDGKQKIKSSVCRDIIFKNLKDRDAWVCSSSSAQKASVLILDHSEVRRGKYFTKVMAAAEQTFCLLFIYESKVKTFLSV